jgi:energy-coupling factor transporter transmembrane protein EcfT
MNFCIICVTKVTVTTQRKSLKETVEELKWPGKYQNFIVQYHSNKYGFDVIALYNISI